MTADRTPIPIAPLKGALAYTGVVIAYAPLLTLLLPMQVEKVASQGRYGVLAAIAIVGALVASGSNILFGWASDRSLRRPGGGRRRWVTAGLIGLPLTYAAIATAHSTGQLILAVALFQFTLNALFAPLLALLADETPDARKGLLGGLFAVAPPVAALAGPLLIALTSPQLLPRLAIVAAATVLCVAPMLRRPAAAARPIADAPPAPPARGGLRLAWFSRLAMQIASTVLTGYLLFLVEDLSTTHDPAIVAARASALLLLSTILPLPFALLLGRWSDRGERRVPFLVGAALLATGGLLLMALAADWHTAAAGFCLYSVGSGVFGPLQVAFVMTILPRPERRGLDLGLINLANTAPSVIGPALAWMLAEPRHLTPLLLTLAGLAGSSALLMLCVRETGAGDQPVTEG